MDRDRLREYHRYVKDIPWHRIYSFYGRATCLESALLALPSDDSDSFTSSAQLLEDYIEHQDAIIHATPFAIDSILRAIPLIDSSERKRTLRSIIDRVYAKVMFGFQQDSIPHNPAISLSYLLNEGPLVATDQDDEKVCQDALQWAQSDAVYQITRTLSSNLGTTIRSS